MRHLGTKVGILDFIARFLKPACPFVIESHRTMHFVHHLFLLGDRKGRIAQCFEMRARFFDGLAVRNRLAMFGHRAVLVMLDHSGRRFFSCFEIVFVKGGRDGGVAFEHGVRMSRLGGSVMMGFRSDESRGREGEAKQADGKCEFRFHIDIGCMLIPPLWIGEL